MIPRHIPYTSTLFLPTALSSKHGAARLIFGISEAFSTDIDYLHLTTFTTESYISTPSDQRRTRFPFSRAQLFSFQLSAHATKHLCSKRAICRLRARRPTVPCNAYSQRSAALCTHDTILIAFTLLVLCTHSDRRIHNNQIWGHMGVLGMRSDDTLISFPCFVSSTSAQACILCYCILS
jgi:hypothetical protein